MVDILIDFAEGFVIIKAKSEAGLKYLKSHWRNRPLVYDMKFVKHWRTELFQQHNLTWVVLSNCTAMKIKQQEAQQCHY